MENRHFRKELKELCLVSGLAVLLALAGNAQAAEMKTVSVGQPIPDFVLRDFNDREHKLAHHKGKIVVLIFSSQECPYSRGVDHDGLAELAEAYIPRGVVFLGIDSHKSTTPEQIKQYATEKKLPYPVLKDLENKYADALGATRTPEFFILDKDQNLAYHGAYDDRKVPEKRGETCYVRDALDNLLAGQPVTNSSMDAWGCTIKRAK